MNATTWEEVRADVGMTRVAIQTCIDQLMQRHNGIVVEDLSVTCEGFFANGRPFMKVNMRVNITPKEAT
jgi:hypothetical protein